MWAEGQSWAVPLHVPMPNPDTRLHLLSASALAPASSQQSCASRVSLSLEDRLSAGRAHSPW